MYNNEHELNGFFVAKDGLYNPVSAELPLTTLNAMVEAIVTLDHTGRIQFANQAALTALDSTLPEIIGRPFHICFKLFISETSDTVFNVMDDHSLEINRMLSKGMFFELWEGRRIPVEMNVTTIKDYNQNCLGQVCVIKNTMDDQCLPNHSAWQQNRDALTQLQNRIFFENALKTSVLLAQDQGEQSTLLYIDVDQFQLINDTFGHEVGDSLLRKLARYIVEHFNDYGLISRLGGDEFGILISKTSIVTGNDIASTICESLKQFEFSWQLNKLPISISIGVFHIEPTTKSAMQALAGADTACHLAKENGRKQIYVFGESDHGEKKQGEMAWVFRINDALRHDRFCLYGQPITSIQSSQTNCTHLEVLVRMFNEQGVLIAPGEFIPPAERYGLIYEIDRWVIKRALILLAKANREMPYKTSYSINLSGISICQEDFKAYILQCFEESGANPQQVCFEVTETIAISNIESAIGFMRFFKEKGCKFSLDDFGSGLSSFGYLKELPVDYLKIDGKFVKEVNHNKIDYAMVEMMNNLGHAMGVKTVAEFVETEEVLGHIKALGIDYAQGYYFSMPQPL